MFLDRLRGVDVVFGCVDNDAARLILNELAVAYYIPYFDVASGIDANGGVVSAAGGRLAVVLPDGPCLQCMGEIDQQEVRYFLASPEERAAQLERGYISGVNVPAPSVISMNALVAAATVNEFAVFVSGLRPINPFTEYDLLGVGRPLKSQYIVPTRQKRSTTCLTCSLSGQGDNVGLSRYFTVKEANLIATDR